MKFQELLNEGLFQKGVDWLIKNTATFEDLYIKNQKNYSNGLPFTVNSPMKNIKFLRVKNGYSYFTVKTVKKELLCVMKEEYKTDMEDYISDDAPVRLFTAKLSKLENNGITPYFITKIREA
jgi:hypothetical protein